MGEIFLDFRPEVTENHLESLERTLPGIKGDDYVMVILKKEEDQEVDTVRKILLKNGFEVHSLGALGKEFAVTAKRLLH